LDNAKKYRKNKTVRNRIGPADADAWRVTIDAGMHEYERVRGSAPEQHGQP